MRTFTRAMLAVSFTTFLAALVAGTRQAQVPGLSGTIVVTNKAPATATVVDLSSGRIVATLPTGVGPHEVVISPSGTTAVVTDYGTGPAPGRTLTVIDLRALKVARTINLGEYTRPHGIRFLHGDTLVVVTSESTRNLVLVNVELGEVRRAIGTTQATSHMVGITADGSRAYTGNIGSHTVSEIDLKSGAFTRSWPVPEQPEAINVTPDGREVWVGSNATGKVSVVDPGTGSVTTAAEEFGFPYRVLYSPDLKTVLLPDARKEELRFLEHASRREIGRLSLAGGGPQGITITPDGRYALQSLSQQASVAIVDVAARTVAGRIAVGDTPDGIAYTTRTSGAGR